MDFPSLAQRCAPDVHITTLAAVVRHESAFNPLAIGINSRPHQSVRPKSRDEAVATVRQLIKKGVDFDVGYGQINVRNWKWLGVSPETIFDPCVNLASAQRVLINCYQRAASQHGPGQTALYAAFSCYNTGNLTSGFSNGYVGKVLAKAGLPVPAIVKDGHVARDRPAISAKSPSATPLSRTDAFQAAQTDAFSRPRSDAFDKQPTSVFGSPIQRRRAASP